MEFGFCGKWNELARLVDYAISVGIARSTLPILISEWSHPESVL